MDMIQYIMDKLVQELLGVSFIGRFHHRVGVA